MNSGFKKTKVFICFEKKPDFNHTILKKCRDEFSRCYSN